ncbi:MAG: hypothetical protein ACI85Z_000544 [Rheinheimera aquimaris]
MDYCDYFSTCSAAATIFSGALLFSLHLINHRLRDVPLMYQSILQLWFADISPSQCWAKGGEFDPLITNHAKNLHVSVHQSDCYQWREIILPKLLSSTNCREISFAARQGHSPRTRWLWGSYLSNF